MRELRSTVVPSALAIVGFAVAAVRSPGVILQVVIDEVAFTGIGWV